jgi:hypothetical protein
VCKRERERERERERSVEWEEGSGLGVVVLKLNLLTLEEGRSRSLPPLARLGSVSIMIGMAHWVYGMRILCASFLSTIF